MRRAAAHAVLAVALLASAPAAAAQESPIEGIWEPDPSRSERFPAEPPFTPAGKRIVDEWRASHDPIEDDPGKFCQAPGMPSLALGGASYPVEIIATPKQVTILMELHQQVRRVHLDQAEHPARLFPQRNGHSIGRWDGETLVVETTNFTDRTNVGQARHSDQLKVTERYTRVNDDTLVLRLTVEDPETWTAPWTLELPLQRDDGYGMFEYACHEGNLAMFNILSGHRADERAAASPR